VRPWTPPTERDAHEDPGHLRPGYGNAELHTWWPLTDAEIAALHGLPRARQGDAPALLALAVLASGAPRDAGSYQRYAQRVDAFVAQVRPAVDGAADEWHRGYELNRAMHRILSPGGGGELGGYDLAQSRVAGIFDTGKYNCISSAMLFVVLGREFGLPVRGVQVPTHAFVEMGAPGGKVLEVETTSDTGFDHVHDERFYRESAARWSASRGLRPVTFEEYQHRSILEPVALMAAGMKNQGGLSKREEDRARLWELAAVTEPGDAEAALLRMQSYALEAQNLYKVHASRTIVRMFDAVLPAVDDAATRWSKDPKVARFAGWARSYYAEALVAVGRGDEAVAQAGAGLDAVDPSWEDAAALRSNEVGVLNDQVMSLMAAKQYALATKVVGKHLDACRTTPPCLSNLEIVYRNWAIEASNAGDWPTARQALQACVSDLGGDATCAGALQDLESRHRF
jgi:hypothetical protein